VEVIISSSRINDISTTNEVFLNLVLINGIVSSNVLTRCGGLLTGIIIIPNAPFRYQLEGYDADGNRFTRTRDILMEAESEECEVSTPDTTSTTSPSFSSATRTSTPVILTTSVVRPSTVVFSSVSTSSSVLIPSIIPTGTPSGCPKGLTGLDCNTGG